MTRSQLIRLGVFAAGAWGISRLLSSRQPRFNWNGKVVLITGGSRGLGLVLARKLGKLGAKVAICARTMDQLYRAEDELVASGIDAIAVQCDVIDDKKVSAMISVIMDRWKTIDVVINNAGIIQVGPLDSLTQSDFDAAIATHVWGPLNVIGEVLPIMRQRKSGRIVNISSIGGKISVPHLLPYCASKFALVGLSEGLAAEVAQDGILVTTVCPGLMRTGSARNALFKGRHRQEYTWFSIGSGLPFVALNAERAADQIIEATETGQSFVALGLPAKVACLIHDFLPGLVTQVNAIVSRALPSFGDIGYRSARGAESESPLSPSVLTALNDQAAVINNEL